MTLIFQQQFKKALLDGSKIHTFRKSIRCSVGSTVNMVINPYNSNREIVRSVMITSILPITIDAQAKIIKFGDRYLNREGIRMFAQNDGFDSTCEMWRYITKFKYSGNSYLYMWSYFNYSQYFKPIVINYNNNNK